MSLGSIPNDIRVPLFYMEFDNSMAVSGTPAQQHKLLVIGQMAAAGSASPLEQYRITNDDEAKALFGNSMLSDMVMKLRQGNSYTETWAMGVADLAEGAAAKADDGIVVTGSALKAGVLYLMIAGEPVQVGVKEGDTAAAMATAIVDRITELADKLPVTASVKAGADNTVTLTSNWKGVTGNDIDIRANYYQGEYFPPGVSLAIGQMANGAGTPDMAVIVGALGDEWFNHIVCPYNDKASLDGLRIELNDRWGPLRMMEGICYTAFRGTHAETGTWGNGRNDHLITCMGTNKSPEPPWQWAAAYGAAGAYYLAIDPGRPLQTLPLIGIKPPAKADRWDMIERNLLLHDGVATHMVDAGDQVLIEREISTYQTNSFGSPDPSYLDITTPATLGYFRYAHKARFTQRFPRHKLADDDVLDDIEPGQPVVTPKIIRHEMLNLYQELIESGLMEGFAAYADTLSVTRDKNDRNRINVVAHPDIINGLRVLANLVQFKL